VVGCAWLVLAVGSGLVLLGILLAADVVVVDRTAVSLGLGIQPRLDAGADRLFRLTNPVDLVEVVGAAFACSAVAFGIGVLLGRRSAGG
jgi:hypothetical protein